MVSSIYVLTTVETADLKKPLLLYWRGFILSSGGRGTRLKYLPTIKSIDHVSNRQTWKFTLCDFRLQKEMLNDLEGRIRNMRDGGLFYFILSLDYFLKTMHVDKSKN